MRIRANTLNANGKKPKEDLDIAEWLTSENDRVVDVYAIGFQEIVPLQVQKSFESARRGERRSGCGMRRF